MWIVKQCKFVTGETNPFIRGIMRDTAPRTTTLSKHVLRVGRLASYDDP